MNNCYKKINCTPEEAESLVPNAVIQHVRADDAGVFYHLRRLKDYITSLSQFTAFGTIVEMKPYVVILDARSSVCKRPDYYNLREDLNELYPLLTTPYAYCILVCDEESPLYKVWER